MQSCGCNRTLSPSAPGGVRNVWFARLLGAYVAIMTTVVSWSLQHWLMGSINTGR